MVWADSVELSQGRRLRTDTPQTKQSLKPNWPHTKKLRRLDQEFKRKQKRNYDHRHRVKQLPDLPDDTGVWVTISEPPLAGRVVGKAEAPRSYVVNTAKGILRRNRSQLTSRRPNPDTSSPSDPPQTRETREPIKTRSRTGAPINPPD